MKIRINSILFNRSLADGPGVRTVLYLQGCDLCCEGCHNKSLWPSDGGTETDTNNLANLLEMHSRNKKLTISGGEPLMQADAVLDLIKKLPEFDIALYTGHREEDVPCEIKKRIRYLKTGEFDKDKRTTVVPYVGSYNQEFKEIRNAKQ